MKILILASFSGFLLCVIVGIAYVHFMPPVANQPEPAILFILGEIFKGLVTFTLIAVGGAFVKNELERLQRRRQIIEEFVRIYSEFYSIRKLYHSALSDKNNIYVKDSADTVKLKHQLLKDCVELEGRYGALKILAITHFNFPKGDYRRKSVLELREELELATDPKNAARLKLDILGETYDDWRHALEENRKIKVIEEIWKTYEELLATF